VWSEFADPLPHNEADEWPTKPDLRAAKANAKALADVMASYVTSTEGGLSDWLCERERSPAIERMVVRELEGRLGPPSG
jgi:hypothetical protein